MRSPRSRLAVPLVAALALVPLVACSGKKEARACPKIEVVGDLSRLVQFAEGPGRDLSDVAYAARIRDVKSGCLYDKKGVTVEMTVSIVGDRAKAGARLKSAEVTYFVAITDASHAIIQKRNFTSSLVFAEGKPATVDDELREVIPLPALASAEDHTIIVGFQLTPEQIDFNQKRSAGS
jgi:hypothetical protein